MLSVLYTILITVLIFGVIIFIHELGHFIVARLSNVTVNEFSLGMGPALWKHQGKKTLYAVRAFPIGGYCAMEGEDAAGSGSVEIQENTPESTEEEKPSDPNGFQQKSVPARIAISAAGAVMNLILGFVVILCVVATQKFYVAPVVAGIRSNASTDVSKMLKKGDRIVKMNHTHIFGVDDISFELQRDTDGRVDMEVKRDGTLVKLPGVDFTVTEKGKKYITAGFYVTRVQPSVLGALGQAGGETVSLVRDSWVSIGDLVTGRIGLQQLSGPVGVGKVVGEAAKLGWSTVLELMAFISISIGVFNLLPFPALDGGRILFLLIEAVRRKPINPKWEGYINAVGLVLLFLLMIVVTAKDIWNLF